MYFGSRISENMVKTPEGYLICKNVPIGRTGWMDYLGEELGIEGKRGQKVKVNRSAEELFSKATIASFEGKPVTNNHPSQNITIETVGMLERGHAENVRSEGDYLIADLYIKDAGLISEVENGKREVSCGYDCLWEPLNDGEYEQKNIVGNHVAVVQTGRAGKRVAIKDSKPENNEGSNKRMKGKVTQKVLAAMGFKAFVQDAEPEEIADAMDAFGSEAPAVTEEGTKDEGGDSTAQILTAISQLGEAVKVISDRVTALEGGNKPEGADAEFAGLEKQLTDGGEEVKEEEAKDEEAETVEPEETKDEAAGGEAMDSLKQFVHDMKPIIMAIPDKKARNEAAKAFSKSVRDRMGTTGKNGYGNIIQAVAGNKKAAMDASANKASMGEAATKAAESWNKRNAHYSEGGK